MKRPEGFDRPSAPPSGASPTRPVKPSKAAAQSAIPATARSKPMGRPPRAARWAWGSGEHPTDAAARRATKARRKYERGEVRRFTRRSRRRRITWLVSGGALLLMVGLVVAAVYSPLLSLKTIRIEGAARVSSASVRAAVQGQIGTPLALVDVGAIKRSLAKFPLIRSFVTETVPPDTLIIRIAERAPIATLATSSGFSVVDPAGIVIETGSTRPPGLPLIELGSATKSSPAFTAAVGVLLALPADLLKRVDTVTAQTADDVTLGLTGGTTVVWGSPEQSTLKARALAAAVAAPDSAGATSFDVSAPTHIVFTKG